MENSEEKAGENLARAFMQFPYLYRYGKKPHHWQDEDVGCLRMSDVMMLFTIKYEQKKHGGVTATQLSADMGIKTPSINVVLSKLEHEKLICRITDPDDRRFVLITLSEEGEVKVTQFRKKFEDRIQELVSYLGVEKSNLLAELMNEVYKYLRKKSEQPNEDSTN